MNIIKALLHNQSNYYQSNHQASFTPNILHQASQMHALQILANTKFIIYSNYEFQSTPVNCAIISPLNFTLVPDANHVRNARTRTFHIQMRHLSREICLSERNEPRVAFNLIRSDLSAS